MGRRVELGMDPLLNTGNRCKSCEYLEYGTFACYCTLQDSSATDSGYLTVSEERNACVMYKLKELGD